MTSVRWASLICDPNGEVDYKRFRSLVSIGLAIAGAVPLVLSMLGIQVGTGDTGHMSLGAGVLITPLTAGRVTDAVLSWKRPNSPNGDSP